MDENGVFPTSQGNFSITFKSAGFMGSNIAATNSSLNLESTVSLFANRKYVAVVKTRLVVS